MATAALDEAEREVLRGIYAAVRDPRWLTIPAHIENLRVEKDLVEVA